uniref:Mitochondrial carrier protein n=1 Tax=Megaselia scalaris TaxID=36166 RepID=T1H4T5_MEGSC
MKVQIQAQSIKENAVGYQHKHKGSLDGFKNIIAERGVIGLWKGVSAIVPRTTVGSSVQLPTFSLSKDFFQQYEFFKNSTLLTAIPSAMVSGACTCIAMCPFDVVSTRIFNQPYDDKGRGLIYKNIVDCFIKTYKAEGFRGYYKGLLANYFRTAPHTVFTLTFWEQFKKWRILYD